MATKTELGGVFTTDIDGQITSNVFVSSENVVGLIFDTAIVGGISAALGNNTEAVKAFDNGNVVEVNTAKDLKEIGLDETVMAGLPYYHVNKFFQLAGNGQRLFISFMDSTSDAEFEAVEKMQLAANGIIYQIGVWTGKAIGNADAAGVITVPEDSILKKLQLQAELLGGKVNVTNYEGNAPINIILNAPVANAPVIDYKKLPDLSVYDFPKVSVILGQPATEETHNLMLAVNTVTTDASYAPVGNIGAALAVLAVAPANKSIAYVGAYNLANIMTEAELGFGSCEIDSASKSWKAAPAFTNINTLGYLKRNANLHKKGYIFLTNYEGLENSIFFSSDQTLSSGDYRTIARCRVMHKSRRVVRRALLPSVNKDHEVDTATGYLSTATIADFQNIVSNALNGNMVEPGGTVKQISGFTCTIDPAQDILNTDTLKISYSLVPRGCSSVIQVTEGFAMTAAK